MRCRRHPTYCYGVIGVGNGDKDGRRVNLFHGGYDSSAISASVTSIAPTNTSLMLPLKI